MFIRMDEMLEALGEIRPSSMREVRYRSTLFKIFFFLKKTK